MRFLLASIFRTRREYWLPKVYLIRPFLRCLLGRLFLLLKLMLPPPTAADNRSLEGAFSTQRSMNFPESSATMLEALMLRNTIVRIG
jgi:hypothetical protein